MESGAAQEDMPKKEGHITAQIEGKKRLGRSKTIKYRADEVELLEVDRITRLLGYSERATALRWLVNHYDDITKAEKLVSSFRKKLEAEQEIIAVLQFAPKT